jgi:hypothetical protein
MVLVIGVFSHCYMVKCGLGRRAARGLRGSSVEDCICSSQGAVASTFKPRADKADYDDVSLLLQGCHSSALLLRVPTSRAPTWQ